jgi:hypothetical protein
MIRNLKLLVVLCLTLLNFQKANANDINAGFDPANTYVFMAGVLEWQSPSLSPFSKTNRKDQEFYNLLISQGVKKENTIFLKDQQATLSGMQSSLEALLKKANPQSAFIFYYAGHGVRDGNGPVSFANYDYNSKTGNGFTVASLSDKINSLFKGKQVWLLADCCYSGALLHEGKELGASGKEAIVFTSSSSSNISTGNWTFTQTLLDCMNGRPICDRNTDKKITIAEVKAELFDAMKYREKQLSGTAFYNVNESLQFGKVLETGVPQTPIEYIYIQQSNKFEPARVLRYMGTDVTGELYHYSDKVIVSVPRSKTKPIAFADYPAGMKVQVEWNGKYYPATIKESKNGFHLIHYTGYDESWNEWVMYDRINTGTRKKCSIEWQGSWFAGEILQEKNEKYFVHYAGYGSDWDEWVGKERVKL